jgi:hypothetical protein
MAAIAWCVMAMGRIAQIRPGSGEVFKRVARIEESQRNSAGGEAFAASAPLIQSEACFGHGAKSNVACGHAVSVKSFKGRRHGIRPRHFGDQPIPGLHLVGEGRHRPKITGVAEKHLLDKIVCWQRLRQFPLVASSYNHPMRPD